jgi:hypothetical protein
MTTTHINTAITAILGAVAPQTGEVVFDLGSGVEGFGGWYTSEEAIKIIRENPRIEFKPVSYWTLAG